MLNGAETIIQVVSLFFIGGFIMKMTDLNILGGIFIACGFLSLGKFFTLYGSLTLGMLLS
jgi:hypothetical protein